MKLTSVRSKKASNYALYKYLVLETSFITQLYIFFKNLFHSESECWNTRLSNEVLAIFFPPQLDVLRMISCLCGSCSKYLVASRKQQPTGPECSTGLACMSAETCVCVRASPTSGLSFSISYLTRVFNAEAPANRNICSTKPSLLVVSAGGGAEQLHISALSRGALPYCRLRPNQHLVRLGGKAELQLHCYNTVVAVWLFGNPSLTILL